MLRRLPLHIDLDYHTFGVTHCHQIITVLVW
nr:MAG TPA: hypothetical protein [Caudoviricetes sp.]